MAHSQSFCAASKDCSADISDAANDICHTFNAISDVSELLNRPASADSSGRSADLILPHKLHQVRRRRDYRVYLPVGYDGRKALPVVMVLHGCHQSHLDIQQITGFDHIADRENFIVVYPYITSHAGLRSRNCWGWWLQRQRLRDTGEVGDLQQILSAVIRDYAVDQSRLHICGLSAGAAMSVVALAAYSDVWKSGASVAGVPYGESSRAVFVSHAIPVRYKPITMLNRMLSKALVSDASDLLVIQSTADEQVSLKVSENLAKTWKHVCQLSDEPGEMCHGTSHYKPWHMSQYADDKGHVRLGYFTVENIAHSWIGGNPGKYSTPLGPNTAELIWAFFNRA